MTIKEAKEWLSKYPDDVEITARVIARNGRGGTFQEDLILTDSCQAKDADGEDTVFINFGFEIGWLNAHPEFQPPADPEAEANEEFRRGILVDLRQAFGKLTPSATEETPFGALDGAGEHEWAALLATCRNLYNGGATSYVPSSVEQLKAFSTFGELIDYLVYGPSADGEAAKLRGEILSLFQAVFDERAGEIGFDTKLDNLCDAEPEMWEALFATCRRLRDEGTTAYCPHSLEEVIACKTFGNLIDYCIKGIKPLDQKKTPTDEPLHGTHDGSDENSRSDRLSTLRSSILDQMRPVFAGVYPYPLEDGLCFAVMDVKPEKWLDLLGVCASLKESGVTNYSPESACQILDMHTFGELIDFLVDGVSGNGLVGIKTPCTCGASPALRPAQYGGYYYACPHCGKRTPDAQYPGDAAKLWNKLMGGEQEKGE